MNVRPATRDDAAFVYSVAMDPSVRGVSTRDAHFSMAEHIVWYDRRLGDPSTRIYIGYVDVARIENVEYRNWPVGYVRYGRTGADAEIAIAVHPDMRRHGYALKMLQQTEALVKAELGAANLVALVVVGNEASSRLFERAGFRLTRWQERMRKHHQRWEKTI